MRSELRPRGRDGSAAAVASFAVFAAVGAVAAAVTVRHFGAAARPSYRDFRDAVYWPGRALLDGRNPYDVASYRAHYPVEQELPAYAPHYLTVRLPLALLPYRVARLAHLLITLALAAWCSTLLMQLVRSLRGRNHRPSVASEPGRWLGAAALVASLPGLLTVYYGQCTFDVLAGFLLAASPRPAGRSDAADTWRRAVGVALLLQKPQLGLPAVVLLAAAGRFSSVWRGIAVALAAALPAGAMAVFAAGGPVELVRSVLRGLDTTAADHANDLASSAQSRVDLAGVVARATHIALGAGGQAVLAVLLLAVIATVAALLVRRLGPEHPLALLLVAFGIVLATPNLPYSALVPLAAVAAVVVGTADRTLRAALSITMLAPVAVASALCARLAPPGMAALVGPALVGGLAVTLWRAGRTLRSTPWPPLAPTTSSPSAGSPMPISMR